ncbi:YceI family protein [Rhabdobacter roseus]|uniref:Polyisoprenoid-binding protein YceI n=1 Tax=Rhabdobacter roseus TaxID=1655419 RepID=A0A840TS83_9BACT|nr:YceI family protein [Rhabdobacter roseus]MBB5286164.1 polyisoprenoid-binding protein YceI [Rhabdobacter roseus]
MKKKMLVWLALVPLVWNCTDRKVEVATTTYALDAERSVAEWKGHLKTGYFNEGSMAVQSENLEVRDGQVTGGTFRLPVSSIVNFNLPTEEVKQQLVHHLQSADFFNMALHPNVTFELLEVAPYTGTQAGAITGANYQVRGTLSLLGKTNPVVFPARIKFVDDKIDIEAKLQIDRTKWGMTYATDPALPAESYIEPLIDLHLKLVGTKK